MWEQITEGVAFLMGSGLRRPAAASASTRSIRSTAPAGAASAASVDSAAAVPAASGWTARRST